MKTRAIPFGYKYETGQIIIDKKTAGIVKEIYNQYINGRSMLGISSLLNKMHIEYHPGAANWNKARIKRIIEDKRYIGASGFPPIISEVISKQANRIKDKRNKQKNMDKSNLIFQLHTTVYCPCCGEIMKRIYEPRTKIHERWKCQNTHCRKIIPMPDNALLSDIHLILNSIICNLNLLQPTGFNAISKDSQKIENEIIRILDTSPIHKELLIEKIYKSVSLKYGDLNKNKYETMWLKEIFAAQLPTKEFPLALFNQAVVSISFDSNNNVTITLINGQVIRKENGDGSAKKEGNSHRADDQGQRGCQRQIPTEASCCLLPCLDTTGRTA